MRRDEHNADPFGKLPAPCVAAGSIGPVISPHETLSGISGSKAEKVADALRGDIATGRLSAGDLIPSEIDLLRRYNVSRPSYREAIRLLEAEGLLRVRRGTGGGTVVLTPSMEPVTRHFGVYLQTRGITVSELFGARIAYEPPIAREIAHRRDQQALKALAQCASAQEFSVRDRTAYHEHERQFRRILVDHSANAVMRLMSGMLDDIFNQHTENMQAHLRAPSYELAHLENGVVAKHRLVRLMAEGDAHRAERAWQTYIRVYLKRLLLLVADRTIEIYPETTEPGGKA
jgi:DNA-binding FadR family transcriptional regulator